jgi:hypothetical protein
MVLLLLPYLLVWQSLVRQAGQTKARVADADSLVFISHDSAAISTRGRCLSGTISRRSVQPSGEQDRLAFHAGDEAMPFDGTSKASVAAQSMTILGMLEPFFAGGARWTRRTCPHFIHAT